MGSLRQVRPWGFVWAATSTALVVACAGAGKVQRAECDEGSGPSCLLLSDEGVDWTAPTEALDAALRATLPVLERACALGEPSGCFRSGYVRFRLREGLGPDGVANARFERACALGHAEGCVWLAESFETGMGAARDEEAALRFYESACELTHTEACTRRELLEQTHARWEAHRLEVASSVDPLLTGPLQDASDEFQQRLSAANDLVAPCQERENIEAWETRRAVGARVLFDRSGGPIHIEFTDQVRSPRMPACTAAVVRRQRVSAAAAGRFAQLTYPYGRSVDSGPADGG